MNGKSWTSAGLVFENAVMIARETYEPMGVEYILEGIDVPLLCHATMLERMIGHMILSSGIDATEKRHVMLRASTRDLGQAIAMADNNGAFFSHFKDVAQGDTALSSLGADRFLVWSVLDIHGATMQVIQLMADRPDVIDDRAIEIGLVGK